MSASECSAGVVAPPPCPPCPPEIAGFRAIRTESGVVPNPSSQSSSTRTASASAPVMSFGSSTIMAPKSPRSACNPLCEWYQYVPGSGAMKLYSKLEPAPMGACVVGAAPSMSLRTRIPCQCSVVSASRPFWTLTFTRSPDFRRSSGATAAPPYVHVFTRRPPRSTVENPAARANAAVVPFQARADSAAATSGSVGRM